MEFVYNGIQIPDPDWEDTLLRPVLSKSVAASTVTVSHVFSYKHGQQIMSNLHSPGHRYGGIP
jgi:hypothetical protein